MRRSPRLKEVNKGFKADCCTSKKCLACNSDPPELSQVMIKKMGHNLCQIDEGLLSIEALNQKKKSVSKKILKENVKPSKVISDDQDEEETLSRLKKRIKKTTAKKEAKKNKKSRADDPNFQDEDGANPEASEGAAPAMEMKK